MQIPPRLDGLLQRDSALHGSVEMGLANFRPWIADNKLPFFPGFTDHGVEHVESVMRGAEALITDDSWAHLGPRDAAALILSILLHDCAMHIHEDGFLALVSRAPLWEVSGGNFYGQLQNPPWPELWDNFKREASRFDDKKLTEIFGSPHNVSPPPNDLGGWTRNHYLYIGEFIRRHHARMAHEIALAGIPGPSPSRTQLHFDSQWFADLVGFIARSHHLNLRTAVDLLPYGYRRDYRGVHVPFVMAVLRIADYIEISAPRAPKQLLAVKMLRSPLSQKEWMKHAAVVHVKMDENDPEALSVDAAPEECTTFLGLRNLFGGIQKELDSVWSSLGEVYGNDAKLRDLKIGLRRIKSTLDNLDTFGKSVAYLPVDARFRTSNGSMLGLLAGPLYGHNPAFGVRELMQNAVDACCERADYQGVNPNVALDLAELEADVVVFL